MPSGMTRISFQNENPHPPLTSYFLLLTTYYFRSQLRSRLHHYPPITCSSNHLLQLLEVLRFRLILSGKRAGDSGGGQPNLLSYRFSKCPLMGIEIILEYGE